MYGEGERETFYGPLKRSLSSSEHLPWDVTFESASQHPFPRPHHLGETGMLEGLELNVSLTSLQLSPCNFP